jgi:hypothetical protein
MSPFQDHDCFNDGNEYHELYNADTGSLVVSSPRGAGGGIGYCGTFFQTTGNNWLHFLPIVLPTGNYWVHYHGTKVGDPAGYDWVTANFSYTASQAEPGPRWVTPHDGDIVPYLNDLVFEVTPVTGAVGYLYSFKEGDQFVWENWSHERHLDGTRYVLTTDSPGALALGFGAHGQTSWSLQIGVRAYIFAGGQYHWSDATSINITLVGFACILGPGGTCINGLVNTIPPNQWPSPDEIQAQLLHIGMGALCAAQFVTAYVEFGPIGVVALAPEFLLSEPCMDLREETWRQGVALAACVPRYSWAVCLGLP